MCFMPKIPKPPALPEAPGRDTEAARAARARAEAEARRRRGRGATILTSALGDPGFGGNIARTTLGGS
jgi:hypothetical protein